MRVRERVRTFLGVWAPLIIGGLLIVFAVNFLLTATTPSGPFSRWPAEFSWDLWRGVLQGGGGFFSRGLGGSFWGGGCCFCVRRCAFCRLGSDWDVVGAEYPPGPRGPPSPRA